MAAVWWTKNLRVDARPAPWGLHVFPDIFCDSRRRVARSRERKASDAARPCGNMLLTGPTGDAAWQADREGEVQADGGDRSAAAGGVGDARVLARGAAGHVARGSGAIGADRGRVERVLRIRRTTAVFSRNHVKEGTLEEHDTVWVSTYTCSSSCPALARSSSWTTRCAPIDQTRGVASRACERVRARQVRRGADVRVSPVHECRVAESSLRAWLRRAGRPGRRRQCGPFTGMIPVFGLVLILLEWYGMGGIYCMRAKFDSFD